MVVGSFIVALCLLVLGWTTEIVSLFVKDAEKVCLFYLGQVRASVETPVLTIIRQKMSP
jgi:hypothetical protein